MPSNITGDKTGIVARQTVVIAAPVDGDPRNAASVRTPVTSVANLLDYLMDGTGLLSEAQSWADAQTFNNGVVIHNSLVVPAPTISATALAVTGKTNFNAIEATATGSGGAIYAGAAERCITGGSTNAEGVYASSGSATKGAIKCENGSGGPGIEVGAGHAKLTASNPSKTAPFLNTLTPANVPKAWGLVTTDGSGGITLVEGFNVDSVIINTTDNFIGVILAGDIATANYAVVASRVIGGTDATNGSVGPHTLAQSSFGLSVFDDVNAKVDPEAVPVVVQFAVFGKQ